ncbi:MAG TPA: hypothetical protein VGE72_31720 [Azospirillum sp.]
MLPGREFPQHRRTEAHEQNCAFPFVRSEAGAMTAAEHPFTRGAYSLAAATGAADDWRTHAAWGLIGRADKALSGLARFDGPLPRFYEAVSLWIDGDDDGAARLLARLPGAHAAALLALIEKPHIAVLGMLPANRHGPHVHLTGAVADPRFRVTNISTHRDDRPIRPYASIHDYVDTADPPDLFIAEMVEWHQIPTDFTSLGCKTIGVTSDYDMHIQGLYPWLRAFDELIVNDHTEHAGLAPILDRPVSVFPLVFGRPADLPMPVRRPRDIDVFMSGTLFAPYHPDKAALLHRVLDIPGINVLYVNGHLSESAYFDLLSRAKVTISYYRRPGGMVTRGIEAACMACVTLVQEGSVVALYADPPHGLIEYDSTPDGLERAVRAVLADYARHEDAAWAAVGTLRSRFAPEPVASRFLRFCAFLAADPRRRSRPAGALVQKRNMFWKGWMPGNGNPDFIAALREGNVARLRALGGPEPKAEVANDIAREALLDYCARLIHAPQATDAGGLLVDALDELRRAVLRDPAALVARFNLARAALHFGGDAEVREALSLIGETLASAPERWRVGADDDVFPYDYASAHFNYRRYIDLLTASLRPERALPPDVAGTLRDLVLASLHHYLARCLDSLDHAREAVRLDADSDAFLLEYARRAIRGGDADERRHAVDALSRMVLRSSMSVHAHHVLRHAVAEGVEVPNMAALDTHVHRLETQCFESEAYVHKVVGGYFEAQQIGPGAHRGVRVAAAPTDNRDVLLSVIVVDGGSTGGDAIGAIKALSSQTLAREAYEIILVDIFDDVSPSVRWLADTLVTSGQDASLFHRHRGFNAGLKHARGRIACLVDGPARIAGDLLQRVVASFPGGEGGALPSRVMELAGDGRAAGGVACRTMDALLCGGVDQHEAYHGVYHDLGEFARRIGNAGAERVAFDAVASAPAAGAPPWARVWPHVAGGEPRRRPHREMPGLVERGLGMVAATPEGLARLDAGFDLGVVLRRSPNSVRTPHGLAVSRDEPPGHILRGPPMRLPGGRYRVTFSIAFPGMPPTSDAEPFSVDVTGDGLPLAHRVFRAGSVDGRAAVEFDVRADGATVDFDLWHRGGFDWAVGDVRLQRL